MKQSHRKIIEYWMAGADNWSPYNSKLAWVVFPAGHPKGELLRVRISMLSEMYKLGMIENRFGRDNSGGQFTDFIWRLPTQTEEDN